MDKNVFKIPAAKYIDLYRTFNPRLVFLVNLTKNENIKFDDDIIVEDLSTKPANFSIRAPIKSNTVFCLNTFNPNLEKITGVEEVYSIFLICNKETDMKIVKSYTSTYSDKKIGIILV